MRFEDAVTYFLGEWPAEGPSVDTVHAYTVQLKWLVGFAHRQGKQQLADVTPTLLRAAMVAKMDPKNHALNFKGGESSAKALVSATRKFLSWLKAQGVSVADIGAVKTVTVPERIQPRIRQDEFQALEAVILRRLVSGNRRIPRLAIARDLALIYMLADTGLRAHEVCTMDLQHVDFSTGSVLVFRGKGKKQRALSILDPDDRSGGITLRLLSEWIEMRKAVRGAARTNRLWVSMKGNPLNRDELRKILARLCAEAGIEAARTPHAFRRASFTEGYLASPSSIRVLSARMGWSEKSHHMVDTYTRGAEVDLARTTPVPSLSARWRESTITPRKLWPIPINGVGPGVGDVERPGPASPGKSGQEPGRLPNPRTGRRLSS